MSTALIDRLNTEYQYPFINETNHQAFLDNSEIAVLFFAGNPDRYPESLDVAVVLPELIQAFNNKLSAGVVLENSEEKLPTEYKFSGYPALVFVKQGICIGTITKIQNWIDYISQITAIIEESAQISDVIPTTTT